jgi:hypothetical protein
MILLLTPQGAISPLTFYYFFCFDVLLSVPRGAILSPTFYNIDTSVVPSFSSPRSHFISYSLKHYRFLRTYFQFFKEQLDLPSSQTLFLLSVPQGAISSSNFYNIITSYALTLNSPRPFYHPLSITSFVLMFLLSVPPRSHFISHFL